MSTVSIRCPNASPLVGHSTVMNVSPASDMASVKDAVGNSVDFSALAAIVTARVVDDSENESTDAPESSNEASLDVTGASGSAASLHSN